VLLITTESAEASHELTRVYDVTDLVGRQRQNFEDDRDLLYGYDALVELVETGVQSESWASSGGSGSISAFDGMLTVKNSFRVHERVAELLSEMRRVRAERAASARPEGNAAPIDERVAVAYRVVPPWQSSDGSSWLSSLGGLGSLWGTGAGAGTLPTLPLSPHSDPAADRQQWEQFTQQFVDAIPKLVAPTTWGAPDGGTIAAVPGSVLVRHTPAVHEEIRRLLRPFAPPGSDDPLPAPSAGGVGTGDPGYGGGFGGGFY
jgi:hypothetical protein